jgi:hypothetical protein
MKTSRLFTLSLLCVSALIAAPGEKQKQDPAIQNAYKTGDETAKTLLKTLGGNLKKHIKTGGPADALTFCSTQAIPLTQAVNGKLPKGVGVKRITLKTRNPGNAAEGKDKAVLQALQMLNKNDVRLPGRLLRDNGDSYTYYKPLVINKPVCLKCHGTQIDPKLKAQINKVYGSDTATGYKMGDLRGAVVVTIKK